MNRISRLTALLLALMMIFSTFAAAETAYSVGGMTVEQWGQLVDQAEDELYTVDEGDAGKTITPESPEQAERGDYYPYSDGVTVALADENVTCQISASGVAILTNSSAGQWQMKIGSTWVNITGETGSTLSVTGAMMNGMTAAEVRKALGARDAITGEYAAYTAVATVEIVEMSPVMLFGMSRADTSSAQTGTGDSAAPFSLQRANDGTTYTVIIDYVFTDGTTAAASWGASLGAGTGLNQVVTNPMVVGYKPASVMINPTGAEGVTYTPATVVTEDEAKNSNGQLKEGQVTAPGSVNLAISAIDQHITVTVTYEPTLVDYTVIHKQQNTDNDNYTEVERVTERGLTGTVVPDKDIARSYPGFYNLLYEQPTIAANGSTVVEISYDRYYYLISFELGGGYGVDPVYGRYGSEVGEVPDPIRPGYDFLGWNVEVPDTIPADHMVITALWKPVGNSFTVVYWLENANDEGYSFWGSRKVSADITTGDVVHGVDYQDYSEIAYTLDQYERRYSTFARADENVTVKGDGSTVVNVYYDRNEYTLKFYYAYSDVQGTDNGNHYVVGGTSYYFGNWADDVNVAEGNRGNALVLLSSYNTNSTARAHRGQIEELPMLNAIGAARNYSSGSDTYSGYSYHYIAFTAKYGADISELWPCNVFTSVERTTENSADKNWNSKTAYVSAWNGEHHVYYSQHNSNETIKGNYNQLDYHLLWDYSAYGDSNTVDYLCFWENGANVGWSIPELYRYYIYVPLLEGQDETGLNIRTYNGVRYYARNVYDTFDNSNPREQTAPAVTGFECINGNTSAWRIKITNSNENNYGIGSGDENWTRISIPSEYIQNGVNTVSRAYEIYFFYNRNTYDLSFVNVGDTISTERLPFGVDISGKEVIPDYPEDYESGAYEFDGWYTSAEFFEGTEFSFDDATMPANHVTLHAKWSPKTYTVRFFLTEDLMETGLDVNVYMPTMDLDDEKAAIFRDVPHGDQIDQEFVDNYLDYNAMTQNGGPFQPYTFIAWFYYDENGVKQPFEPATQIKQNLDVFAEWSSNVLVSYTIRYAVPKKNADGSYVLDENKNRVVDYYVAAETTGSALAGTSKTFEAKGGAELYADYQTGCFPETESHTLRFETEDAAAGVEYIFWYTDEVKVPYKVFYVTEQQNDDNSLTAETIPGVTGTYYRLETPKSVDDNENAVVTETFKTIPGYMPDAYQKRLIVTNDGNPDNDVIIFIYTKDEQHAYYRVTHYIENLDTDAAGNTTWTEYTSSQFVGDIGKTKEYNNDPLTISGFAYSTQEYVVKDVVTQGDPDNKATLTADGMQINLYYVRKEYPYKVQYLLENTMTVLAPEKNEEDMVAKYEDTVTEYALDITNYVLVSADPQSLTIRIEEDSQGNILTNPTLNIITFYYREKTGEINYQAVCPDNPAAQNFGSVTPETEELSILSGVAKGSTAAAGENYTFVGWYDNEACSGEALTTEAKYVPTKADGAVWPESTTYYAKFEENEVTLKYAVVTGCEAMGTVAPTEETLKVLSGKAVGSKATAGENYKFVGWYDNAQGSGTAVATTEQFVPTKGENEPWLNGKTWYAKFEEKQATITYVAVGNGTVNPESETLNVVTGVATGSTATAATNHHFVGWYTDADCKVPVAESWVTEGKITPVKADGTVWPESTTYYAKFEEDEVTINYVAALRADGTVTVEDGTGGLVDLNDSDDAGKIKTFEYVKVSTGTAVGATAEPNANYKFVGWYDNAACSGEALSTNASYVPGKTNGLNTEATYYALFELDVADLVIEKTVNGEENPPIDPFELTISLPDGVYNYTSKQGAVTVEGVLTVSGGTGAMVIRDGEKITIHDIAIGSAYAVEEADLPWFDEVIEASGTQIAAENNRVTITNTYRTGTLTVKKVVAVQAGVAAPSADTEFTFEVELKNAPLGGSVAVSIDNAEPQSMPLINGKLTFKLKDGQMAKIEDLPRGTDYVVTEVNVPDNFVVSYDGMEAGKIDGDVITTVTNNYPERYADLTVTKNGLQASKESAIIDVVVTTNNVSTTYTLVLNQANPSATITRIPVGSNYTVTERDTWTWGYKDTTAQTGAIVDGGSTVNITNTAEGDKWMHDESYLVNNIQTGGSAGVNN